MWRVPIVRSRDGINTGSNTGSMNIAASRASSLIHGCPGDTALDPINEGGNSSLRYPETMTLDLVQE